MTQGRLVTWCLILYMNQVSKNITCNLASKQNLHSHPIWHSCCTQSFRDKVVIVNTFTKSLQDNKFIYHNHNTITLKILSISKNTTTAPTLGQFKMGERWLMNICDLFQQGWWNNAVPSLTTGHNEHPRHGCCSYCCYRQHCCQFL